MDVVKVSCFYQKARNKENSKQLHCFFRIKNKLKVKMNLKKHIQKMLKNAIFLILVEINYIYSMFI